MNLVVEGIKKQYSKTVLQNINLTISKPGVYLIAVLMEAARLLYWKSLLDFVNQMVGLL